MKRKIQIVISYLIRISLLIAIGLEVYKEQWDNVFFTSLALFATFLPSLLARNAKIVLPTEMELTALFFIFIALFLGDAQGLYAVLPWLDVALHLTSGIILGLVGFFIVYILNADPKTDFNMNPLFVAFFSFAFGISIGATWEILEFSLDSIYPQLNMQNSSLADTMWDLITDFAGALIVAIMSYFYLKRNERGRVFNYIKKRIIHFNPKIFDKF